MQALQLKISDSHLTCKVVNKCLNVRERVEVVEWKKKKVPSLPLLTCESSVFVKENPDRKKIYRKIKLQDSSITRLCKFWDIFNYTFFTEHLRVTGSVRVIIFTLFICPFNWFSTSFSCNVFCIELSLKIFNAIFMKS